MIYANPYIHKKAVSPSNSSDHNAQIRQQLKNPNLSDEERRNLMNSYNTVAGIKQRNPNAQVKQRTPIQQPTSMWKHVFDKDVVGSTVHDFSRNMADSTMLARTYLPTTTNMAKLVTPTTWHNNIDKLDPLYWAERGWRGLRKAVRPTNYIKDDWTGNDAFSMYAAPAVETWRKGVMPLVADGAELARAGLLTAAMKSPFYKNPVTDANGETVPQTGWFNKFVDNQVNAHSDALGRNVAFKDLYSTGHRNAEGFWGTAGQIASGMLGDPLAVTGLTGVAKGLAGAAARRFAGNAVTAATTSAAKAGLRIPTSLAVAEIPVTMGVTSGAEYYNNPAGRQILADSGVHVNPMTVAPKPQATTDTATADESFDAQHTVDNSTAPATTTVQPTDNSTAPATATDASTTNQVDNANNPWYNKYDWNIANWFKGMDWNNPNSWLPGLLLALLGGGLVGGLSRNNIAGLASMPLFFGATRGIQHNWDKIQQ